MAEAISVWGRIDALVNNAHTFTDYMAIEDPKLEEQHPDRHGVGLHRFAATDAIRLSAHARCRRRVDHQFRLELRHPLRTRLPGLCRQQGGHSHADQDGGQEWGKYKIRVNTILPSACRRRRCGTSSTSKSYDLELSKVALGYFGTPDDIAPLALFLASDESNYITGQTIGADGGSTML